MILHEAAHRLVTPGRNEPGHGRRFAGCLIGLVCRHLDYDASELMQQADEMGVLYDVRSIGSVPVHGPVWHVRRAVAEHGPMTAMEIACHLDVLHGQHLPLPTIYGAALAMIRSGQARWFRGKLHLCEDEHSQGAARDHLRAA